MGAGSKLVIAGLALGCIGFGIWYFIQTRKNYSTAIGQRLIPFTAAVDPTTGIAGAFTNAAGEPQLQCPAGTTINIVGAFFDISDPYGECSAKPSAFIQGMCDPSVATPQACTASDDCNGPGSAYQFCNSSGFCQLNSQSSASACIPDSNGIPYSPLTIGTKIYCVPTDVCNGSVNLSQPGIPNPVCSVAVLTNTNQCATRDATDSVGAKCNGRPECSDLTMADFGQYPCPNLAPTTGGCMSPTYDSYGNPQWTAQRTGYCGLPYLPGWTGGPPAAPQGGNNSGQSNPASSTLGYFMHGLYACV